MKETIKIITEGEFDRIVLSKLLSKFKNIEFISASGFSSSLAKVRTFFQQGNTPILLVLDTDSNKPDEIIKKKKFVKEYLGLNVHNSLAHVVWMQPELEILFLRNKSVFEKITQTPAPNKSFNVLVDDPKNYLDNIIEGGRKGVIPFLNDSSIIEALLADPSIKEIIDFIEINRNASFLLSNKAPKKTFVFQNSNDFLAITKSFIRSLHGKKPNEWSSELMNKDIYFKAKLISNKGLIEYGEQHFQYMVSPYHAQPVFEDYFVYPAGDEITNNTSFEIEVLSKDPNYEFEVQFIYDVTKGVNIT